MRSLYEQCLRETDSNRKGKLFEEFVAEFFRGISGFDVDKRLKICFTDLDVVVKVDKPEHIVKYGNFIVVQCRNIKDPLGPQAILELQSQAKVYGSLVKIAVLATTSKLTNNTKSRLRSVNESGEIFIVVIEGEDWEFFLGSDLTSKEFFDIMIKETPKKYR